MKFKYFLEPETPEACIALRKKYHGTSILIAGGTDVVPRLKGRTLRPEAVISLRRIAALRGVSEGTDGLFIGAFETLADVSKSALIRTHWPVVAEGAGHVSSMQVRNVATIGGNTCNASPSADTVPCLIVMGAEAVILGEESERRVPLERFLQGPGKTDLGPDELLKGFLVPPPQPHTGAAYEKYAIRGDSDIAIVGAAACVVMDGGIVKDARIALGSVGPTALRAHEAEDRLRGNPLSDALAAEAARLAAANCAPIDDHRASADYRRKMVAVCVERTLKLAAERANA